MIVRYIGKDTASLTTGKCYEVIRIEDGWYRIVDNTEEDYLFDPEKFEIVEEKTERENSITDDDWQMFQETGEGFFTPKDFDKDYFYITEEDREYRVSSMDCGFSTLMECPQITFTIADIDLKKFQENNPEKDYILVYSRSMDEQIEIAEEVIDKGKYRVL